MKAKTLALVATGLLMAGQAQAIPQLVAGWDFSQSCLEGNLCDAYLNDLQTLPANYSDLDPTDGMGLESNDFGTMLLDGSAGSSSVPGYGGWFTTVSPDLTLNTNNHSVFPLVEMGALANASIMQAEFGPDQPYQQHAMRASETVDVVFAADLGSTPLTASDWEVSFAALSEGASTVAVSFSADGLTYNLLLTEALGTAEEVVTVALGGVDLTEAYVKLSFDLDGAAPSRIDNLAIRANVIPEPGTVLLLALGLGGLAILGRRRS